MSYGRNFGFRRTPDADDRGGRWAAPADVSLPIGVPVKADWDGGTDSFGLQYVELATGAQAPTLAGCGIIVYEYITSGAFAGEDPSLVTYSDKDSVPAGAHIQLVHGVGIKVVFTNTDNADYFDFSPSFQSGPRVMVAGIGATPTVVAGDYLTPGVGNGTSGYWAETGSASNAWFQVTAVDLTRHEVEAEMLF